MLTVTQRLLTNAKKKKKKEKKVRFKLTPHIPEKYLTATTIMSSKAIICYCIPINSVVSFIAQ